MPFFNPLQLSNLTMQEFVWSFLIAFILFMVIKFIWIEDGLNKIDGILIKHLQKQAEDRKREFRYK
jgi:hypothetical protein